MSATTAAADILEWASKLDPWQRDGLRRLASAPAIADGDVVELLAMVKQEAGFTLATAAPASVPLDATHLGAASAAPKIQIKAIRNIKNVNRLASTAGVTFSTGLTVIYGTNGSGKTGFIRILRRACRTRINDAKALKILGDVYSTATGPNEAEIVIETGAGEQVVPWKDGDVASELMLRAAVFDSKAAELYVDEGNQIRFLPFGLALPHKLNELVLTLRGLLESERRPVQQLLVATRIDFLAPGATVAQIFYNGLKGSTADAAIDAAASFSAENESRLEELDKLLAGSPAEAVDRRALAAWLEERIDLLAAHAAALSPEQIDAVRACRMEMSEARAAADLAAAGAFAGEPLTGVGNETWRRLWEAARLYSIQDAYPALTFPVTKPMPSGVDPRCVLCQQALDSLAQERLERFESFVSGALATKADAAAQAYAAASDIIVKLDVQDPKETASRIKQVKERAPDLAALLSACAEGLRKRQAAALKVLAGEIEPAALPACPTVPDAEAKATAAALVKSAAEIEAAALDPGSRATLETERQELRDRRLLSQSLNTLKARRDLLREDALFELAIGKMQTQGITKRANELIDKHLTTMVKDVFTAECKGFNIAHLSIGLSRESSRKEAVFKTETGTTLTRASSDILSEGEQRALALAGFLTEAGITAPDGPIVVDDPVSSLDRERSLLVAKRLVTEAAKRQVIVFTHDLIFYNQLCGLADDAGLAPHTCRVFRNANGTGLLDPSGAEWRGMKVSKRIGLLKNDMAQVAKLHNTEPGKYEYEAKNIYGRLRDAYERAVEEYLFKDTITRYDDVIKTQNLRYVGLPHEYALRFHTGMTKANTFSHDNPAAGSALIPEPDEILQDIAALQALTDDFKALHIENEKARPQMKA